MSLYKFKFSEEILEYAKLQVIQIEDNLDYYSHVCDSEFKVMKQLLPTRKPKTVLELGCGIGRMSVFLNQQWKNEKIKFLLLDSNGNFKKGTSKKDKYGWNPSSGFYNDLNITKSFCQLNSMTNFDVYDVAKTKIKSLKKHKIDMVMAFLSVGFHYPIETYLEDLLKITTDDCIMVFGIRKGKYKVNTFEKYFSNRYLKSCILNGKKRTERLLVMWGKK